MNTSTFLRKRTAVEKIIVIGEAIQNDVFFKCKHKAIKLSLWQTTTNKKTDTPNWIILIHPVLVRKPCQANQDPITRRVQHTTNRWLLRARYRLELFAWLPGSCQISGIHSRLTTYSFIIFSLNIHKTVSVFHTETQNEVERDKEEEMTHLHTQKTFVRIILKQLKSSATHNPIEH